MVEIQKTLQQILEENPSFILYDSAAPTAEYAKKIIMTLNNKKIRYGKFEVEYNSLLAKEIKDASGYSKYPVVYIDGKFIGGASEFNALYSKSKKK